MYDNIDDDEDNDDDDGGDDDDNDYAYNSNIIVMQHTYISLKCNLFASITRSERSMQWLPNQDLVSNDNSDETDQL